LITNTTTTPTEMPVIDSPLDPEVADVLGDELIMSATTKTQRVSGSGRSTIANQSGESRAWTRAGYVD
jgi:hypothetical protein